MRKNNALLDNIRIIVNAPIHLSDNEERRRNVRRVQRINQLARPRIRSIVERDRNGVRDSAPSYEPSVGQVRTTLSRCGIRVARSSGVGSWGRRRRVGG